MAMVCYNVSKETGATWMSDIEVIGIGALNIDHFYRVESILDDGEAVVEEMASFPRGSAANTIYGLAKLGVRA